MRGSDSVQRIRINKDREKGRDRGAILAFSQRGV